MTSTSMAPERGADVGASATPPTPIYSGHANTDGESAVTSTIATIDRWPGRHAQRAGQGYYQQAQATARQHTRRRPGSPTGHGEAEETCAEVNQENPVALRPSRWQNGKSKSEFLPVSIATNINPAHDAGVGTIFYGLSCTASGNRREFPVVFIVFVECAHAVDVAACAAAHCRVCCGHVSCRLGTASFWATTDTRRTTRQGQRRRRRCATRMRTWTCVLRD